MGIWAVPVPAACSGVSSTGSGRVDCSGTTCAFGSMLTAESAVPFAARDLSRRRSRHDRRSTSGLAVTATTTLGKMASDSRSSLPRRRCTHRGQSWLRALLVV